MPLHRKALPQLRGELFLTDGGIETDLIFHDGADLPLFAAFDLLKTPEGTAMLRRYFERYLAIAARHGRGFILESPTWRANPDWARQLGYDNAALAGALRESIALMESLRNGVIMAKPVVISGCIGPRGDGYVPGEAMTIREAEDYHSFQARIFAGTEADMITAITMTNVAEATGVSRAAAAAGMPVAISFTVETDGRLPTGQDVGEAIMEVDFESSVPPAYYMINCAHPSHFTPILEPDAPWLSRLKGLRVNASKCSHAELNEAPELDDGNPCELGLESATLRRLYPSITVLGGCCGTDSRHIEEMARAAA
ncbi:MAG: homocysteine S-methyltransferase family protein [Parvularculaceae bacterium]